MQQQVYTKARSGDPTEFEQACGYCGARFRVLAWHGPRPDRLEEYACPECGKRYDIEAADEPGVKLLQPRSDGKTDRYQDTVF